MSARKGAAEGAPSYLDTKDITRARQDRCAPGEAARILAVGEQTKEHRAQEAKRLRARGREKEQEALAEGMPPSMAKEERRWFEARAKGHHEAPERAILCGADEVVVHCPGCAKDCKMRAGCRKGLLCRPCRDAIAARKRASAQASALVGLRP